MTTDKIVFYSIAIVTVLILGVIVFTSFKTAVKLDPSKFITQNANRKGPENSKVTIIEFSDYQCPFCGQFALSQDQLLDRYKNDLSIVFRHFPLPMHDRAMFAAKAAEAAGVQGKFWEFSHMIFSNQANLADSDFEKYAKDLKLDSEKFKSDYNSEAISNKVKSDLDFGNSIKLNSTPTFFLLVDGKIERVRMAKPEDLEKAIQKYITPVAEIPSSNTSPANIISNDTAIPVFNDESQVKNEDIDKILAPVSNLKAEEKTMATKVLQKFFVDNKEAKANDVKLKSIESKEWPDASLGCSKAGAVAIQVITPGYKVILTNNGKDISFNTNMSDKIVSCD